MINAKDASKITEVFGGVYEPIKGEYFDTLMKKIYKSAKSKKFQTTFTYKKSSTTYDLIQDELRRVGYRTFIKYINKDKITIDIYW